MYCAKKIRYIYIEYKAPPSVWFSVGNDRVFFSKAMRN